MSVARTCCPTLANKWENSSPQTKAFLKFIAFCIVSGAFAAATYGTNYAYGWLPANQAIAIPIYVLTGVGVTSVILLIKFCVSKTREPAPSPAPSPQPSPPPSPKPDPQPHPQPEPRPAPQPPPKPGPQPQPQPRPAPQPHPEPEPQPAPAPKPADKMENPFLPAQIYEKVVVRKEDFYRFFVNLSEEQSTALQDHLQDYEFYVEVREVEVKGVKARHPFVYYKFDGEVLHFRCSIIRDDGTIVNMSHSTINEEIVTRAVNKGKIAKIRTDGEKKSFFAFATQLVPPVVAGPISPGEGPSPVQPGQALQQEEEAVVLPAHTRMHKVGGRMSPRDFYRVFTLDARQREVLHSQLQEYEFYFEATTKENNKRFVRLYYKVGGKVLGHPTDLSIKEDGTIEVVKTRVEDAILDQIRDKVGEDKVRKDAGGIGAFLSFATQIAPLHCPADFWLEKFGPYTTTID